MSETNELNSHIGDLFAARGVRYEAKPMMGGIVFMVRRKMCVGTTKGRLMVRFDPVLHEAVLARPGAGPMDFTKRVMRGFVFVSSAALPDDAALGRWLDLALAFNPQAKRSARKKTKRALKAWTRSRFEFAIQRAYHSLRQYPGPIPCS